MSGYVPVRLSTLKGEVKLNFALFIPIGQRYVLYSNEGDALGEERRLNLRQKKVRQLFIEAKDEHKYQEFLESKLQEASTSSDMSSLDRADVAMGASCDAVEKVYEDPGSKLSYTHAQKTLDGLVSIISQNDDVVSAILQKSQHTEEDNFIIRHSINVSTLAVKLALSCKLEAKEVQLLGMGGFLHDIGVVKMEPQDRELFRTPYENFSKEQMSRYKTHPQLAADLLQDKEYATKEVIELILTHEENLAGKGFPKGLSKLTKPQEMLSLCCAYDRRISCLGESHQEVIKDMMINSIGLYDLELLKAFKAMLKAEGLLATES